MILYGRRDQTGLIYLNNRYHDPQLGVFISVEPLVGVTLEPYMYASANPMTLSDPLGLCGWKDPWNCGDELLDAADDVIVEPVVTVVETTVDVVEEGVDRGSEFVDYVDEATRRRLNDPLQTWHDLITGTYVLEDLSAAEAILVEGGELFHDNEYCGSQMTCITDVITGKKATTTGHTVRFSESTPSEALRAHEAQHVFDYETLGGVGFVGTYFGEWGVRVATPIDGGYHDLWTEQRAYEVTRGYSQGVRPSRSGPMCTGPGPC